MAYLSYHCYSGCFFHVVVFNSTKRMLAMDMRGHGFPLGGHQDPVASGGTLACPSGRLGTCRWIGRWWWQCWGWWYHGWGPCRRRSGPGEWWTCHNDGTCEWVRYPPSRCEWFACPTWWLDFQASWPVPQWSAARHPAAARGTGPGRSSPRRPTTCDCKRPWCGRTAASWYAGTEPWWPFPPSPSLFGQQQVHTYHALATVRAPPPTESMASTEASASSELLLLAHTAIWWHSTLGLFLAPLLT